MSEIASKIDLWQIFLKYFRMPKLTSQIPSGLKGEIFVIMLGAQRVNMPHRNDNLFYDYQLLCMVQSNARSS